MSRWVWGREAGRGLSTTQQLPPLCSFLGRFSACPPLSVEVDCQPSKASLLLWRGLLSPIVGMASSPEPATVAPCRAFPTLDILSWRVHWGLPERAGGLRPVKNRAGFTALVHGDRRPACQARGQRWMSLAAEGPGWGCCLPSPQQL